MHKQHKRALCQVLIYNQTKLKSNVCAPKCMEIGKKISYYIWLECHREFKPPLYDPSPIFIQVW